ncbi:MAG: hypothetical protein J2P17_17595 [Mycobacterium sp.]|nr:hypothetical protein [Mycobacterium sp.]
MTLLPPTHGSLARGVPPAEPGTIHVLSLAGGITFTPREGRTVTFGRNRPDVHVCLGEDDPRVSRQHGTLRHEGGRWWLSNTGRLPIRLPAALLLFRDEESIPLDDGYTPMFVRGSIRREHLLEVHVTGASGIHPRPRPEDVTQPPRTWMLSDEERLALVALGQRYLLHEVRPQPLSWKDAADELALVQPDAGWTHRKVEHTVVRVRSRLSKHGVSGLTRDEIGEPVGNSLNDNLIHELLLSTTLVPPDLTLLDPAD